MAYTAWRGAVEIKVGGFPVPVNVAFQPRLASKKLKAASMKLLSPDGQPVKQQYVTDDESWKGTSGDCGRGVEVGGEMVQLTDETIAALNDSERSTLVEPDSFAPLDSIDFALSDAAYAVVADDKVPAADRQVEVVWNGLRYSRMAYITRIVMRGGSLDRIVAIYADDRGLWAVGLPFEAEINDSPELPYEANDEVGAMFAQAIEAEYDIGAFDPANHPPEAYERQTAMLESVLAGGKIEPVKPEPKADAPDLMAVLAASIADAKPKAKAKTKKAKATA